MILPGKFVSVKLRQRNLLIGRFFILEKILNDFLMFGDLTLLKVVEIWEIPHINSNRLKYPVSNPNSFRVCLNLFINKAFDKLKYRITSAA